MSEKKLDPTESSMFLDSTLEVICFRKEWLRRGLENICGCPACKKEREAVNDRPTN
jgi:hypothetical protein